MLLVNKALVLESGRMFWLLFMKKIWHLVCVLQRIESHEQNQPSYNILIVMRCIQTSNVIKMLRYVTCCTPTS